MKVIPFLLTSLVFSLLNITQVSAQDLILSNLEEKIQIKKDSSFVKQVTVLIKPHEEHTVYPIFYDSELEEISNIKLYNRKGKRYKEIEDILILEEDVELDYIASKKIKSIIIPPGIDSRVTYEIKCNELMYLSNLPLFVYNEIDTLSYQISIPQSFHLAHDIINKETLDYFYADSTITNDLVNWNFVVTPGQLEPNPLALFGIYRDKKVPLIRTIVTPISFKDKPKDYLNHWYLSKVKEKRGLNITVKQKLDEITNGISRPKEIMETVYNYVKNNFKYVAVEIGMGAFIPSHANEVFSNKEGDCKDLSNFLSEALNYKGIKSDVALAATFNHVSDCDFPSLSSANHVVCLAYIDQKPIILDPTDPIHSPETPVESIQNRSILIINSKGGNWFKAKSFSSEQNAIDYDIFLKENSKEMTMTGEFRVAYKGITGNFLQRMFNYMNNDERKILGKKHFSSLFGNQKASDIQFNQSKKSISANGWLVINGKILNDSTNQFIFLDFLPRLFETETRNSLLEGTHFGSNFRKRVKLRIELEDNFENFERLEHSFDANGINLNFSVIGKEHNIIECSYDFKIDYSRAEKDSLEPINKAMDFFNNKLNEPLLLKIKA